MQAAKPDPLNDLDERTARLQEQLTAKSSLFDVLSPPPPQKLDPAAAEDAKLQSAIRAIAFGNVVLLVLTFAVLALDIFGRPSSGDHTYLLIALLFIVGVGQSAVIAFRILRRRIAALEAELREARRTASIASSPASSDATNLT